MDSQLKDIFFDIIKKLPIELLTTIFTSGVTVLIASNYFYKLSVKWRHRQVMVADDVSKLLRNIFKTTFIIPIPFLFILWVMDYAKINTLYLFIFFELVILGLDIFIIYSYIKTTRKKYMVKILKGILRKLSRFFFRYLLAVILLASVGGINILLVLFTYLAIIDFSQMGLKIDDFILTLIAFYILSPCIIYLICSFHEEGLKKGIKAVAIIYNQNGKKHRAKNIKFEDFDINKDFVSFYSNTRKCKRIIQTKDLLRIEYYYD